jgi:hypothetical protein
LSFGGNNSCAPSEIPRLEKYLKNNVTVACVDPLYCLLDNNNGSRAALTASRALDKSNALGPMPTKSLIGIKL